MTSLRKLQQIYSLFGPRTVLLPIQSGTKKCLREGWQCTSWEMTQQPSYQAQLASGGIAVLFGPENLAGLDCDTDGRVAEFLELNPWAADTLQTRGARGRTFHFRIRGNYPKLLCKLKSVDGQKIGEWRGADGYTVVSGIHPDTGEPYKFLVEKPPLVIDWSQIKWLAHWNVPWQPKTAQTETSATPDGDLSRRILAYMAGCPPAVSGNGGHIQTLKIASQLVVSFALGVDGAMPYLREYNKKCVPPWSEKELLHKAQEASRNKLGREPGAKFRETTANGGAPQDEKFKEHESEEGEKLFPYPKIDELAFYGPFGRIVKAIAPLTEADPVGVLVQLLVGWGNLIGRSAYFSVSSTKHFTNLFCCLVGRTSRARKGLALGVAQWVLGRLEPLWATANVRSGLSSGEGLIWRVRDPIIKTQPVKEKGRYTGEFETYVEDEGIKDKRLLVAETEFASALSVMGRSGNTLSAVIRDAFDSKEQLGSLVKNSPGAATKAHISIIEQITRHELQARMKECEQWDGFANRFIWVCTNRARVMSDPPDLSEAGVNDDLLELAKTTQWAKEVEEMERDEPAAQLWDSIYCQFAEDDAEDVVSATTDRGDVIMLRLQMLYALSNRERIIKEEHVQAAHALWKYAEDSARYLFGARLGNPKAEKVFDALRHTPQGLTRWDINTLVFKRNIKTEVIDEALKLLLSVGWIERQIEKTDGRDAERFYAKK
jgi:hypothetical protein